MTPTQLRDALRARPAQTALFTDFDGTLSPIVADPATARPYPGAIDALAALVGRYRRVAVLSGRPLDYLDPLLPAGIDIAALYGLEQRIDGHRQEHPEAAHWRPIMATLATDATDELAGHTGVTVEPKGLSLTVHFRNATRPEQAAAAVRRWAEVAGARHGLHPRAAKASVELHPPIAVDKGTQLVAWAAGAQTVAFFGDDVGDLPAYQAVRALAATDGVEAINVLAASDETPEELRAVTDVVLDGPPAVAQLFAELARG
ncbi:MAG: trehalose-phosphatase [Acidimicrobiia bacterium]